MSSFDGDQPYDLIVSPPGLLRPPYRLPLSIGMTVVMLGPLLLAALLFKDMHLVTLAIAWVLAAAFGYAAIVAIMPMMRQRRIGMREIERIRGALQQHPDLTLSELMGHGELGRTDVLYPGFDISKVIKVLLELGRTGFAVRYATDDKWCRCVEPLRVPFEPVPLHEDEPAFQGLTEAADGVSSASQAGASGPRATKTARAKRRRRFWVDNKAQVAGEVIMCVALGLLLVGALILGSPVIWGPMLLLCAAGPFALWARRGTRTPSAQTWVFPGGIAVPRPFGKVRWQVIRRSEGALAWYPDTGTLHLFDARKTHTIQVTPAEAYLALQAWYSTSTPPTPDQLQERFGE